MVQILNKFFVFFDENFKRRFIIFVSIPLILSLIYLTDFYLLPESKNTDFIIQINEISINSSAGGTHMRTSRKIGYKYKTKNNLKFSTLDRNINFSEVQITNAPIFNTVKSVVLKNEKVEIFSGFNGINKAFLIICNLIYIISILYTLIVKKINENNRLNLVFLNLFMLVLWFYFIIKFDA